MGKVEQGVAALWVARHYWKKELQFIGYGGTGKQVRDFLHVLDLCELLELQLRQIKKLDGQTFNVGGGVAVSASLRELTAECQRVTRNRVKIRRVTGTRPADLRVYLSDCGKLKKATGWRPKRTIRGIVEDIYQWIHDHDRILEPILR